MKPSLQLRIGQQLTMTPQLQQAIRLLQLSSLELQAEINELLAENPLLDREEALEELAPEGDEGAMDPADRELDVASTEVERLASDEADWGEGPELVTKANGQLKGQAAGDSDSPIEIADGSSQSLREHLLWQLNLSRLSDRDRTIGEALIYNLNDQGYLTDSSEDIGRQIQGLDELDVDEIEAVRHRIQRFDPVGTASVDLRDCLLTQLEQFDEDTTPALAAAKGLADRCLDLLARQKLAEIQRELAIDEDTLRMAVALIRSLDPRPGSAIPNDDTEYVTPDVYVRRNKKGKWEVVLNAETRARLKINEYYASLIKKASKADAEYLRVHLQEARWFMKSLETRNDTLLKVAQCIVKHQQDFFESGPVGMKPLVLREIAESIDMHESTVSRITTRKYLHCPRGVFEFKYFFSSHVGTSDGGECSATAIQAMIQTMIGDEPPEKPLSDSRIANTLNERGIEVARRTVAKYREALGIPSSSRRKRLI